MILNRDLTTTGTSTTPFTSVPFATSSSSPTGGGSPRNTTDFAKSALEYIFLALAIFLLTSSIWLRLLRIRQSNQPYSSFFHFRPIPAPTSPRPRTYAPASFGANTFNPYSLSVNLADIPPAARNTRRELRSETLGAGGRRLDSGMSDYNHPGEKDVLPRYEKFGGPPGYADVHVGAGAGEAPPPPPPSPPPPNGDPEAGGATNVDSNAAQH